MKNYIKIKTFSPFKYSYMFVDCEEYLADQLFIKYKVPVEFGAEFGKADSKYVVISCKIKKKYEKDFLAALSEMDNKMLLRGYENYQEICEALVPA